MPAPGPARPAHGGKIMEARITELEIKLSFAEDLLETLNQTVYRQQREIELLRAQVAQLADQMRHGLQNQRRDPRDEIPPHY
jgi:SlyX protein